MPLRSEPSRNIFGSAESGSRSSAICSPASNAVSPARVQPSSSTVKHELFWNAQFGFTSPTNESKSWLHRYGDQEISQFRGAELIAEKWNISREEMEQFALASHQRLDAPGRVFMEGPPMPLEDFRRFVVFRRRVSRKDADRGDHAT